MADDYSQMTLKEQDELCRKKASQVTYEEYKEWLKESKWLVKP